MRRCPSHSKAWDTESHSRVTQSGSAHVGTVIQAGLSPRSMLLFFFSGSEHLRLFPPTLTLEGFLGGPAWATIQATPVSQPLGFDAPRRYLWPRSFYFCTHWETLSRSSSAVNTCIGKCLKYTFKGKSSQKEQQQQSFLAP